MVTANLCYQKSTRILSLYVSYDFSFVRYNANFQGVDESTRKVSRGYTTKLRCPWGNALYNAFIFSKSMQKRIITEAMATLEVKKITLK